MAPREAAALQLSFTKVETLRQCPLRFRFLYVDRLPSAPSHHLSWGRAIHGALEAFWGQKLPQAPPLDVLLQGLDTHWEHEGFAGLSAEEGRAWYRYAQDVLRRHHQRYARDYLPAVASEQRFAVRLSDDLEVTGSIDHVSRTPSGGLGVLDWKTHRRLRPRAEVRRSLQLAIYALAAEELWGVMPEWVGLEFVVPGVRVTVPHAELDLEGARAALEAAATQVRSGCFPATPQRLCGYCEFQTLCPAFRGEGRQVPARVQAELTRLKERQARDAIRIAELEAVLARTGADSPGG